MRLWIPTDPATVEETAAMHDLAAAATKLPPASLPLYSASNLSVRLRLVHKLPAGPLAVRPDLPSRPPVATAAWVWSHVLEGILWEDCEQIGQLFARREWGNVAGVEVSL